MFLGEKMGWHRWSAVLLGFAGMMVIVQPGAMDISGEHGIGLIACMVFCVMTAYILLLVKKLSASEDTFSMMFYLHLWMGYMALPMVWFVYQELTTDILIWGVVLAITSIAAHYSLITSYTLVDITLTAPFEFSRILMASGAAYMFLGEVPSKESYIGAAMIVASTVYIVHREAKLKRKVK